MHAHSHITQAVAGGKAVAVGVMNRENPCLQNPYCRGECKAVYQALAPHNTCGSCWPYSSSTTTCAGKVDHELPVN